MILYLKMQGQVSTCGHPLWYDTYRSEAIKTWSYYWTDDKIKRATQNQLILMQKASDPQTWKLIWHRKGHELVQGQT